MVKKVTAKKTAKNKKEDITNVIFLLDNTGSMYRIKSDTIGGFNTFISEQKKLKNNIKFSLTLFNSFQIEKRYINVDINDVEELNEDTYNPNGTTPLNDAIGKTINEVGDLKNALFVIMTDGEENASIEFDLPTVKKMIEDKEKLGWTFLYLGVDVTNFVNNAMDYGIKMSVNTFSDDIKGSYQKMSKTVNAYSISANKSNFNAQDEFEKS